MLLYMAIIAACIGFGHSVDGLQFVVGLDSSPSRATRCNIRFYFVFARRTQKLGLGSLRFFVMPLGRYTCKVPFCLWEYKEYSKFAAECSCTCNKQSLDRVAMVPRGRDSVTSVLKLATTTTTKQTRSDSDLGALWVPAGLCKIYRRPSSACHIRALYVPACTDKKGRLFVTYYYY